MRPPDFFVQAFLGVIGPDLTPQTLGEGGKREDVLPGRLEVVGDLRQLFGKGVRDPVEVGV